MEKVGGFVEEDGTFERSDLVDSSVGDVRDSLFEVGTVAGRVGPC